MNLSEIRNYVWRALGEDTNLDPTTDDTYYGGIAWLTAVVNEAQRHIASWKDPGTGRPIRIYDLLSSLDFYTVVYESTVSAVNSTTFPYSVTIADTLGTNDDRYNGWVVEFTSGDATGDVKRIVDYTGATRVCYVHEEFASAPEVGDTVKVYKGFEMLLPATHAWVSEHVALPTGTDRLRDEGNLLEVLSITDLENESELNVAEKKEKFAGNLVTAGTPTQWSRYGNRIVFDVNADENRWYKMEYYRLPLEMSADTDEPDLPVQFHFALVLWATWWGFWTKHENARAYSVKRDLEDEMRRVVQAYDVSKERVETKAFVDSSMLPQ
jgi:hypothetical protein